MSEDLKKKKSEYLLELALEEQLDQDMEMKKYEKIEETEPAHVFSKEHDKRMQELVNYPLSKAKGVSQRLCKPSN